jgi:hypothetical protein
MAMSSKRRIEHKSNMQPTWTTLVSKGIARSDSNCQHIDTMRPNTTRTDGNSAPWITTSSYNYYAANSQGGIHGANE